MLVAEDKIPIGQNVPLDNLVEIYKVYQDMVEVCKQEKGIGLSAVQIGVPWKMFIVHNPPVLISEKEFFCGLNCEYTSLNQEKITSIEGCLSLKDKYGNLRRFLVERYNLISVTGKSFYLSRGVPQIKDVNMTLILESYGAVMQHEIDHQFGILVNHIGQEVDVWS